MLLLLAAMMVLPSAAAQLIELNGGLSSIYQAEGGTVTLHGHGYQVDLSAGIVAGRAVGGAEVSYNYRHTLIVLGTEQLRLNLPTDLFNDYHRLVGVGASVRKTTKAGTRFEAFAGETSNRFDTPLFEGIRAEKPAGAFLLEKSLRPTLRLYTQAVYASKLSVIQSLAWKPVPELEVGFSAGLGAGARYGAASANLKRRNLDLKASYIDVGQHFARTGSQIDLSPEPIRENVLFTWRSQGDARLTLTGGRQNFVVSDPIPGAGTAVASASAALPDAPSSISTLNQISGSVRLERIAFTASLLQSSYKGAGNVSFAVAAARTISREMRVQASYYESHPHGPATASVNRTVVAGVQREITSRITASGTATLSNGQTNVSFGGSILSNRGTLSVDYQTFYVPTRPGNPFQQALVLDMQLNILGKLTGHAATFLGATGKLLYTADLHASQGLDGAVAPTVVQHVSLGECVLKGRVLDRARDPVEGAALSIDGKILYTDSDGRFFLRDKKPEAHSYDILLDQFLDGGTWRIVSRPLRMQSTREPRPDVVIVVERSGGAPDSAEPPAQSPAPAPALQTAPTPAVTLPPIPFLPEEPAPASPTAAPAAPAPAVVPPVETLSPPRAEVTPPPTVVPSQPQPPRPDDGPSGDAGKRTRAVRVLHAVARTASWLYTQAAHWRPWQSSQAEGLR